MASSAKEMGALHTKLQDIKKSPAMGDMAEAELKEHLKAQFQSCGQVVQSYKKYMQTAQQMVRTDRQATILLVRCTCGAVW